MTTLDITNEKATGTDLANLIEGEFNATQRLIVQPYPSKLKVTPSQFKDLEKNTGNVEEMYGETEDRMWRTADGYIMEIEIDYGRA